MTKSNTPRIVIVAHITAFVVAFVWGSTFVFTKILLSEGLSAAHIFTLRFALAYVLLTLFSAMRHDHRWLAHNLRDELLMLLLGVTGGSLYFLAENESLRFTTTTNTSLIVCSCPLVAAILIGCFYRSERLNRRQMFGSAMAVMGVATVVLNGRFVLHLSPRGDLLALTANLCWAVYSLLMIPANHRYSALFITRKVFFYGLLTMIPYYMMVPGFPPVAVLLRPVVVANVVFLGFVASMLCFLVWTWVMRRLGSVTATNYVYVNPIATVIFSWWLLAEPITPFFVTGAVLIVCGMIMAERK